MNLIEVEEAIVQWSADRGILRNGKALTQCLKLMSELGELADNLAKGNDTKDDIGDCFVVLTNIARLEGHTLVECANVAYEDIKDRKGFLNENGNFIKSTDVNYEQLLMDFNATADSITNNSDTKDTRTVVKYQQVLDGFSPYEFDLLLSDKSIVRIELTDGFMRRFPNGLESLEYAYILDNL